MTRTLKKHFILPNSLVRQIFNKNKRVFWQKKWQIESDSIRHNLLLGARQPKGLDMSRIIQDSSLIGHDKNAAQSKSALDLHPTLCGGDHE